jgi:tRNA threonylcarbamoyladenosine biosynthesis protein TsaE
LRTTRHLIALHTPHLKALNVTRFLADENETLAYGAALGRALEPGLVIYLTGELGAGKTTFARGVLRGLGYAGGVKSPSFALVEVYKFFKLYLYHFDFYRFDRSRELEDMGFREYFRPDAVCLIEWPEKAPSLPQCDLHVTMHVNSGGRTLKISSNTEAGQLCTERLQAQ